MGQHSPDPQDSVQSQASSTDGRRHFLMSRSDTTFSPFPRAPRVSWRAIGPQHCFQIRRAVQNVANSASTTMATVLITGDSTGLESGNDSLNVYDTAFGLITRKIQAENPGVSFRFINRAIGGNTWGNLNAAGTGNLPAGITPQPPTGSTPTSPRRRTTATTWPPISS